MPTVKHPDSKRTFHEAVGWKAEDFFTDPQVVELCRAIEANDLERMKQLLDGGVDVNAIGTGGMTPLLWSFFDNNVERFELLLDHGADPSVKITTNLGVSQAFAVGDSAATLAAHSYYSSLYDAVVGHVKDFNITGAYGQPFLHIIIRAPISQEEKRRRILLAIEHGADIQQKDSLGTLATTAVGNGQQWELVLWLLDQGVDSSYCRPLDHYCLVHHVLSHEDRLTPGREQAYVNLLERLRQEGHDLDTIRKQRETFVGLMTNREKDLYIKSRIAEQVRSGLRPDPELGEEASEAWYAERRRQRMVGQSDDSAPIE
ncbi:ankyrin [Novipirellula rosea]